MHAINLEENSVFASKHMICMVGPATGHSVKIIAMCVSEEIAWEIVGILNGRESRAR